MYKCVYIYTSLSVISRYMCGRACVFTFLEFLKDFSLYRPGNFIYMYAVMSSSSESNKYFCEAELSL